jgi:hypothetical protein
MGHALSGGLLDVALDGPLERRAKPVREMIQILLR